jgi:alcohol dehydrogenase YqhD (iron-dependent ADH family)
MPIFIDHIQFLQPMKPFDLHIYTRLIFGAVYGTRFAEAVANLGSSIFIVTGGGSVKRLGYLDEVTALLARHQLNVTVFEGIEPNPQARTINRAARTAMEFGADVVLALGGGSVMDASKAIGALVHDGEDDIWPFVLGGSRRGQFKGMIPLAAIPTTAATASEVTPYAVISNDEVNGKAPIGYPFMRPAVSWLNPAFTLALPDETTRDGASDILSHMFENYIIGGSESPLADRHCEGVMAEVLDTLPRVMADPENLHLRGVLLWASSIALSGYQQVGRNPSGFPIHAMEHALSGYRTDLAHGRGLATLYPAYFRWLIDQGRAVDRFAQLGRRLFNAATGDDARDAQHFIERFDEWLQANGLWQSLTDLGIPEEAWAQIADYTIRIYGDGEKMDVLGALTAADVVDIFRRTEAQTVGADSAAG